ncbi:MAG: uridine kinase [Oscillospiraceae bacterium]|nr:uridine kinase [Oscillospiraceae bacterium]
MQTTRITEQIKSLLKPDRTLIIGIDGLGGAGKSTVSEAVYGQLCRDGYNVTLLHIDDFIHPRSVRYNNSIAEWECYYNIQWRYDYLVDEVIQPIKSGVFKGAIELYDKGNDTYYLSNADISVGSIIIIEGVFLQREELRDLFDFMIYIDISESVRLERVLERDGYIGNKGQIKAKYDNRYFPAERYYVEKCLPAMNADYVIKE